MPEKRGFKPNFMIIFIVCVAAVYFALQFVNRAIDWDFAALECGGELPAISDTEMVLVEGGTFTMGCTPEQGTIDCDSCYVPAIRVDAKAWEACWSECCDINEKPTRSVTVGNFLIGKYLVTQRLWKEVMGAYEAPPRFKGDRLPAVTDENWDSVQGFIAELNRQTGKKYRLPTEAEWEYAARGGNKSGGYKYSGSDNVGDVAWYGGRPRPVGTKLPNELGIYDMSGNVWEWVSDWYGYYAADAEMNPSGPLPWMDNLRAIRGGSWNAGRNCRVATRAFVDHDYTRNEMSYHRSGTGIRLALDPAAGEGSDTLAVKVAPEGGGSVSRDPDLEAYPAGTNVTLAAEAARGYSFEGWTASASGAGNAVWTEKDREFRVAVIGNMEVTALFEKFDIEKEFDVDMVPVQGGTFTMGCTHEQHCYSRTQHVVLSDFRISKNLVTQRLWRLVMGDNPSYFKGNDSLPVERVSWNDVQEFIAKLNQETGKEYRLPTEAEWEYAARGGKKTKRYEYSGSNNIKEVGWYGGNSDNKTQPVGTKQPNELGIHDMTGNVGEWVNDWYEEDFAGGSKTNPAGPPEGPGRVIRSCDWYNGSAYCGVAARGYMIPDGLNIKTGFRLALSP